MKQEYRVFEFKATALATITGYVWARDSEEAKELIECQKWDELEDYQIDEVEEVEELREEE